MVVICFRCEQRINEGPGPAGLSHGLCAACATAWLAEIRLAREAGPGKTVPTILTPA